MMSRNIPGLIPEGGVIGKLPFDGQWLTERSPTRRVPSHGTHLFATTYALDFVAVDDDGLTAPPRSVRALFTPNRQSSSTPSVVPCTRPLREPWSPFTTASPTTWRAVPS